ncbi:Agglutinin-like protein, putative, partial [Candida maltosa Xu316]
MILSIIFLVAILGNVQSAQISGVFTSFNSLVWQKASSSYTYSGPSLPTWMATLGWTLDGATARPGDTFTLIMDCTYKFVTDQTSINLVADGTNFATCAMNSGAEFLSFSSLQCTITNALTSNTRAYGTVTVPIAFNVGGSGSSVNLHGASCFKAGTNQVTFQDGNNKISTQVNFQASDETASNFISNLRLIPSLNQLLSYALAPSCPSGYNSGTLGFYRSDSSFSIDCSSINAGISNAINDWNFPETSASFSYTTSCSSSSFSISYQNIPAGFRPFISSLISVPSTSRSINMYYTVRNTCSDRSTRNSSPSKTWNYYANSNAIANGAV